MIAQGPSCIEFRMGASNAPDSPWGRDELDVFRDGRIVYKNVRGERVRSLTARLAPSVTDQLFAALAASPFPQPPSDPIPPGGSLIELTAKLPEGAARVDLCYHSARKKPGYDVVVRMLTGWTGLLRTPADQRAASNQLLQIVECPT